MQTTTPDLAAHIARYASAFHARASGRHHVGSPLGAWLLLALCAPAASGADAAALADALGCDGPAAARFAAELLSDPHPLVGAAAAAWSAPGMVSAGWLAGLPAAVAQGPVPSQAELDSWARESTFGLIGRFPLRLDPATYLVLATALATRVSWQRPFQLAAASELGSGSPWAARVARVLRMPSGNGHAAFIAATETAGDVAVHTAVARDGLLVTSVIAAAGVPPGDVLAVAHQQAMAAAAGNTSVRRSLYDLPLGDGPAWTVREEATALGGPERCTAVLPAWSAHSTHELADPALGFPAAVRAVAPAGGPWQAAQTALARYSRTGFEAAAVTGVAVAMAARVPGRSRSRVAELQFGHPYAVVAVTLDHRHDPGTGEGYHGPWHGVPVFSAWVAEPDDAAEPGHAGPDAAAPASAGA
ncbi:MAG: hypothetical protein ACLQDY_01845 [Streptosporangiaceae bacterium]